MKYWYDENMGVNLCEPDCADEWLELIHDIGYDYDNCRTVESLKELIDELVDMAHKARVCLHEGRVFDNRKLTQFKRIKNMTVEEMAEFLVKITGCCTWDDCEHCPLRLRACTSEFYVKEWLESEVQGE